MRRVQRRSEACAGLAAKECDQRSVLIFGGADGLRLSLDVFFEVLPPGFLVLVVVLAAGGAESLAAGVSVDVVVPESQPRQMAAMRAGARKVNDRFIRIPCQEKACSARHTHAAEHAH